MAHHTFFSFHYERDVWRAGKFATAGSRRSWIETAAKAAGH